MRNGSTSSSSTHVEGCSHEHDELENMTRTPRPDPRAFRDWSKNNLSPAGILRELEAMRYGHTTREEPPVNPCTAYSPQSWRGRSTDKVARETQDLSLKVSELEQHCHVLQERLTTRDRSFAELQQCIVNVFGEVGDAYYTLHALQGSILQQSRCLRSPRLYAQFYNMQLALVKGHDLQAREAINSLLQNRPLRLLPLDGSSLSTTDVSLSTGASSTGVPRTTTSWT